MVKDQSNMQDKNLMVIQDLQKKLQRCKEVLEACQRVLKMVPGTQDLRRKIDDIVNVI